ncbi:MAG: DNA-directed RNA polymerase subunit beta, partial [Clostridia bacterium]|nr:DNA-directed RNA polymerase subunit beta [Clostridia bacterium]
MHLKETKLGKTTRMSFSKLNEALDMPNLIEVQKKSFEWFLQEGLLDVLHDVSPVTDFSGKLTVEFVDFSLDEKPRYPIEECKEKDVTYDSALRVTVRITNKDTGEVKQSEIYMCNFPRMTENGTFVINGAERVIVSQLVRSPGIYYACAVDKLGKHSYSNTVIPYRGAWLEYETDANDVFYVKIDKNKKVPITTLIRALGIGPDGNGSDEDILSVFGEEEILVATLGKDICQREAEENNTSLRDEALKEIYRKLHPGDPPLVETALTHINNLFFDPKRYDLQPVGRYKFDKKLALAARIAGFVLARPVICRHTGEVLAEEGATVTRELAEKIDRSAANEAYVRTENGRIVKVFANDTVYPEVIIGNDLRACGVQGKVRYSVLSEMLEEVGGDIDALIELVPSRLQELAPKHITKDDIFSSINYLLTLSHGIGSVDDIDHLGNRRLRCVGELLQNQFRI